MISEAEQEPTYSNDLSTNEREGSLGEDSSIGEELALRAADVVVLVERTRVLPVPETKAVMVGTTTQVEYDTEDDEAHDGDDLDGREDKLCFTIHTGSEQVDDDDDNKEY